MALASPKISAGVYTVTWKGLDLGLTEGPIRMQQTAIGLPIRAQQFGQTIIDYVMQGGGAFGVIVLKEWTSNVKKFIWPFAVIGGATEAMGQVERPGTLLSQYTGTLVLTALAGTKAAEFGPVTRTYQHCAALPGHNIDITFGPTERNIVVALAFLPDRFASPDYRVQFYTDT